MKVAVLASKGSWYLKDLQRAAGGSHEIVGVEHHRLATTISGPSPSFSAAECRLDDFDAVLVRTMEAGSLEQVVFRMDVLARLEAAGKVVVNAPRAIEAAVDKYLATAKCHQAGLQVPATIVCQNCEEALEAFSTLGEDVVVKPLFGGEGRGLFRVTDPDCAWRACKTLERLKATIYLQQFIPHKGHDIRLFVVGSRILAMRRSNPSDWRSNVSRGATTESVELTDALVDIARRASAAVQAEVAGVDVLPGVDGKLYLLEVNAVPGWQALARTLDIDVAKLVLDHVESLVARRNGRSIRC